MGYGAVQNKIQAHTLINLLCDRVPTLKKLHVLDTTTEIGLRAAKTLAMNALGLHDSIQLVTWLHSLPVTKAKDFLTLIQDSHRATVVHILEGWEHIARLNLATQGYLTMKPLQGPGGHPIREHLLPFILVFERELFPRLTYMQNLLKHAQEWTGDIPQHTTNIITYDPLLERENRIPLFSYKPHPNHPHLRPTIKRMPHENPVLDDDDLLELYGYDEERGYSQIVLEPGTAIEFPIEDEQGVTTWIVGRVLLCHEGSLDFRVVFPGSSQDTGGWRQLRSRADTDVTWHLPHALRKRHPAIYMLLNTQGYTPWHNPQSGSH